jgi:hypothetical protein
MSRAGKGELAGRIDEVTDLLINHVGYRAICSYAEKRWGVGERQACAYIAKAKERILKAAEASRSEQHARALASYESLYAKAVAAGRLGEARKTLDSIVRLLGLAAPERLELHDFSSFSDEQLAEELAHELPELLRAAERAAGRDRPPLGGPQELTGALDPPHSDS